MWKETLKADPLVLICNMNGLCAMGMGPFKSAWPPAGTKHSALLTSVFFPEKQPCLGAFSSYCTKILVSGHPARGHRPSPQVPMLG